jgi:hypothetical protein
MCIFVVLCVDETYYFICMNTVMQLNCPNPVVGRGYILNIIWLAKEVNKEVKKKLQ